jgi:GNAT superfamily N-acetyltransferase
MDKAHIAIVPLEPAQFETYIRLGRKSYSQHYLHLWADKDPTPYFENSFQEEAVHKEWKDPNCLLFLIQVRNNPAGILKILINKSIPAANIRDCLFLERIYLLTSYSGQGLGTYTLEFIEELCAKHNKQYICLESMQKGRALAFYKKKGFTAVGEKLLHYPGIVEAERPMYIMCKDLSNAGMKKASS